MVTAKQQPGVQISAVGGGFLINGVIDEFADFSVLLKAPAELRLDLSGVSRINSIGLRNFMIFLKNWSGGAYSFIACPVEFVDQMNLIPSILKVGGSGWVESCMVPLFCTSCGKDAETLIKLNPRPDRSKPMIKQNCPHCGGACEVAVEGYFNFLQFLR